MPLYGSIRGIGYLKAFRCFQLISNGFLFFEINCFKKNVSEFDDFVLLSYCYQDLLGLVP